MISFFTRVGYAYTTLHVQWQLSSNWNGPCSHTVCLMQLVHPNLAHYLRLYSCYRIYGYSCRLRTRLCCKLYKRFYSDFRFI